jgi:hypothetical protein
MFLRYVSPCHHGMARPQVAGGGTASNTDSSCEYIEYAVADSRQWVVPGLEVGRGAKTPHRKIWPCYETDAFPSDLDSPFVTT